jgi:selenide,water dikinase
MSALNKTAAEIMEPYEVHACTDITGFGLMGHASEMAKGSGAGITIVKEQVPVLPRVRKLAEEGFVPGGTKNNFAYLQDSITFPETMDQIDQWILCDAVTSGGLLISVTPEQAEDLLEKLVQAGVEASLIGEVTSEHAGHIVVN